MLDWKSALRSIAEELHLKSRTDVKQNLGQSKPRANAPGDRGGRQNVTPPSQVPRRDLNVGSVAQSRPAASSLAGGKNIATPKRRDSVKHASSSTNSNPRHQPSKNTSVAISPQIKQPERLRTIATNTWKSRNRAPCIPDSEIRHCQAMQKAVHSKYRIHWSTLCREARTKRCPFAPQTRSRVYSG